MNAFALVCREDVQSEAGIVSHGSWRQLIRVCCSPGSLLRCRLPHSDLLQGLHQLLERPHFHFSSATELYFQIHAVHCPPNDIAGKLRKENHRSSGHTEEWMLMVRLASLWIYMQGSCRSWTFCIHFHIHRHNKKWVSYSQGFRTWTASRSVNYVFVSGVAL